MTLRVPGTNVAITPVFDPDTTESGRIIIPDIAKERCDQGVIKYIGPEVQWLREGDYVLFSGYSGTLLSVQGEGKLIILPERFVIAKLDPPDTDVPGLYFRSPDGVYFTATYEMAMELIANACENSKWRPRKPMRKDYSPRDYGKDERYVFAGHSEEDMVSDDLSSDKGQREDTNVQT